MIQNKQLYLLPQTPQLIHLLTLLRNQTTPRSDFIFTSDRIIRLLIEDALNLLQYEPCSVLTPLKEEYKGLKPLGKICGVSIMRAGESMESGLRDCCKGIRIGKILIQRDEKTALPKASPFTFLFSHMHCIYIIYIFYLNFI
jgi:uracil phosphoribosyltransferase